MNLTAITPYSTGIINLINGILVPVLFAIAFLFFIYGVYKYFIYHADNEAERSKGRAFLMWSIIGFAVILSVWGIVNVLMATLGFSSATRAPAIPTIGGSTGTTNTSGSTFTSGTTYSAGSSGTSGSSVTPTQSSALNSLNSQSAILQSIRSQYGLNSTQYAQAYATYMQDYNNYKALYGGGSTATPVTGTTCTGTQKYDSDSGTCVDSVLNQDTTNIEYSSTQTKSSEQVSCEYTGGTWSNGACSNSSDSSNSSSGGGSSDSSSDSSYYDY